MISLALTSLAHGDGHGRRAYSPKEHGALHAANVRSRDYAYRFDGKEHVGFVAYPTSPAAGPRPGALIGHQWTGVQEMERSRAEELAARGFVVLVPDVYGKGKRPAAGEAAKAAMQAAQSNVPRLHRMLAHAVATLKQLGEGPAVNSSAIVANGYCFGGQLVLEMARANTAGLLAVSSFHGSLASLTTARAPMRAVVRVHHASLDAQGDAGLQRLEAELQTAQASGWATLKYGGVEHGWTDPANRVYAAAQAAQAHESMLALYEQMGLATPDPQSAARPADAGSWGAALLLGLLIGGLIAAVGLAAREQRNKQVVHDIALASMEEEIDDEEEFPSSPRSSSRK